MAFGGLRSRSGIHKYSGRYYLNVDAEDPTERIAFFKETEVQRRQFDRESTCIAEGYFPLSSNIEGETLFEQWMRYLQSIKNAEIYSDGKLPPTSVLDRRNKILQQAFSGINDTKLAVYIVPKSYDLGTICDIFETLNTTGTKVSTVDLIHSWLYKETNDEKYPIRLRDWIDKLGELDDAVGWASSDDRPELIAQMVTACYIALDEKSVARSIRGKPANITTVKSGDLLYTPTQHWRDVIGHEKFFAKLISDFQYVVAEGPFRMDECPYPVSSAIYIGLRWHMEIEGRQGLAWNRKYLDALYRAFFWRNALTSRYDQGFLSQLGTDLKEMKAILASINEHKSPNRWSEYATEALDRLLRRPLPTAEQLKDIVTDGRPTGHMQRAVLLPMLARVKYDFVDPKTILAHPFAERRELHHIFPTQWCKDNIGGPLREYLDEEVAGRDWVGSVANLVPLSRKSNNEWKTSVPEKFLREKAITFELSAPNLEDGFIDKTAFRLLTHDQPIPGQFWEHRSQLIAQDLLERTKIKLD